MFIIFPSYAPCFPPETSPTYSRTPRKIPLQNSLNKSLRRLLSDLSYILSRFSYAQTLKNQIKIFVNLIDFSLILLGGLRPPQYHIMIKIHTPGTMNSLFSDFFREFWRGILGGVRDYVGEVLAGF